MIEDRDTGPLSGHPRRTRSELALRVVSALVLAVIVLASLLAGGFPFALVWLVAGIVGFAEWLSMARAVSWRPLLLAGGSVLAVLAFGLQAGAPAAIVWVLVAVGLVALMLLARDGASRRNASIGLLAAMIIVLVPPILRDDPGIGILGPAWMFAVVWSTDIAAYFTGRSLGGPKLMPRVSPNKTWSGALGGLAAAMLAGTGVVALANGYGSVWLTELPLGLVAAVSAVASMVSQAGDLAESGLKRRFGVKDSGHSIPGHGGIMDRLDGFFAVALLVGLMLAVRLLLID